MTQRIHSLVPSGALRRTLKAREQALQAAAGAAPPRARDRVWRAGYMSVSLLAIAAAGAIAGGEAAIAELRFATAATAAPGAAPLQDICAGSGARTPHEVRNIQVRPSIQKRKSA